MLVIRKTLFTIVLFVVCGTRFVFGDISNFTNWEIYGDPVDANMTGSATADEAQLNATGPVSSGTDIGFSSVNGRTVNDASNGYFFSPASDFEIAVDYDLSHASAMGGFGLGFGIGEERTGENSAGIGMATNNGAPLLTFAGAARVNNVTQTAQFTGLSSTLSGSMFVSYDAATGDITLGASTTQAGSLPEDSVTYAGVQNQWNDNSLMASFFIRSQAIPVFAPNGFEAGTADAIFSNFRVINGQPIAVPEPNFLVFGSLSFLFVMTKRRR